MPQTYRIKLSDGREFDVATDGGPPSEQDILANLSAPKAVSSQLEAAPPPTAADAWKAATLGVPHPEQAPLPNATPDILPAAGGAIGGLVGGPAGAAVGGAAGELGRQAIEAYRGGDAPTTPLEAAAGVAKQAGLQGVTELAGPAVQKGLSGAAKYLMTKAVKPGLALQASYRTTAPKIVQTLLDEGINVTAGGVEKLQSLLKATNDEIKALVDASPAKIEKARVLDRLQEAGQDALKRSATPQGELAAIEKTGNQFIDHPLYPGDLKLTPAQAQDMKQGIYERIGKSYGAMKPGKIAGQKALARGLKEEIADAVPAVKELNKRDASLMAAGEAVTSAVSKDANADPLGLLFAAHNPELFLAGLINKQPVIKSLLAHGAYKMAGLAGKVSPQAIRAAVAAIASSGPEPDQE